MPKYGRGQYPLKACVQWYIAYWRERAMSRLANENKTRKQQIEADILEARLAERRGTLIARAEVLIVMQSAYRRLGKALDTLPTQLAKEFGLPPEFVTTMRERIDDFRKAFVKDNSEFIGDDDSGRAA